MQAQTTSKKTQSKQSADPMMIRPFSVVRVNKETEDTFSLTLKPQDSNERFDFEPGQFNMLYQYGVGEVPISISSDPDDNETIIHTIRRVGNVTGAMAHLRPNDTVGLRGPFGTCWPIKEAEAKDVVIIAGGIGLAPLRPVIYYLLRHRRQYGRVTILYGARTPQDLLFTKELEAWGARFDMYVDVTVDQAAKNWFGNVGVVPRLINGNINDPSHTIVMMCGPEIMMRFTFTELERHDITDDKVYLSMERNMKCGVGLCGHCQLGHRFICKDGPVYRGDTIRNVLTKQEM